MNESQKATMEKKKTVKEIKDEYLNSCTHEKAGLIGRCSYKCLEE